MLLHPAGRCPVIGVAPLFVRELYSMAQYSDRISVQFDRVRHGYQAFSVLNQSWREFQVVCQFGAILQMLIVTLIAPQPGLKQYNSPSTCYKLNALIS